MSKHYSRPSKDFTMIPNAIFRDKSLSLKERGLWATIASCSDSWDCSINGFAAILPDKKGAISAAVKNLEEKGYLTRNEQKRNGGRFGHTEWILDYPSDNDKSLPCSSISPSGNSNTDTPSTEKAEQINTTYIQDLNINTNNYTNVVELLNPFNLNKKDIEAIYITASGEVDKISQAVKVLKASKHPVINVSGFIISAIKNNYKLSSYEPKKISGFNNFTQRDYNYEQLMEDLLN